MGKKEILTSIPFILLFLLVFLSILAPYLEYRRIASSQYIYWVFHHICHQMPTHSFWTFGSNMALCARCFSIYVSLLITGIFLLLLPKFRFFRMRIAVAFIAMLPMVTDGLSQFWGIRESDNFYRTLTGALAGIGLGIIFFPAHWRIVRFIK